MPDCFEEVGRVVASSGNKIQVQLKRHASCEKCGACGLGGMPKLILEVNNSIGAQEGDWVLLQLQAERVFKAAFLLYTIPLIALLFGYWAGESLGNYVGANAAKAEILGIFSGFAVMACSYLGIRWLDRHQHLGQRFQPQLVQVVPEPPAEF